MNPACLPGVRLCETPVTGTPLDWLATPTQVFAETAG